jgi:hypothetical protein
MNLKGQLKKPLWPSIPLGKDLDAFRKRGKAFEEELRKAFEP